MPQWFLLALGSSTGLTSRGYELCVSCTADLANAAGADERLELIGPGASAWSAQPGGTRIIMPRPAARRQEVRMRAVFRAVALLVSLGVLLPAAARGQASPDWHRVIPGFRILCARIDSAFPLPCCFSKVAVSFFPPVAWRRNGMAASEKKPREMHVPHFRATGAEPLAA